MNTRLNGPSAPAPDWEDLEDTTPSGPWAPIEPAPPLDDAEYFDVDDFLNDE